MFHGFKTFLKLLTNPFVVAGSADENCWMRTTWADSPRSDSHDRVLENYRAARVSTTSSSVVRCGDAYFFCCDDSCRPGTCKQLCAGNVRDGDHVQALQLIGTVAKEVL